MKTLNGTVISIKMTGTAVVSVAQTVKHPVYKKELKRHKKYKVDTKGFTLAVGDAVVISEIKPMAKEKNFKVLEVVK